MTYKSYKHQQRGLKGLNQPKIGCNMMILVPQGIDGLISDFFSDFNGIKRGFNGKYPWEHLGANINS